MTDRPHGLRYRGLAVGEMAYHTQRRPVMNRLFVGMDVHKEKIVLVGFSQEGHAPVVRETFGGEADRVIKRLVKLSREWKIEACYEAGPSGYGLARDLVEAGLDCRLGGPALIPRPPGDRVQNEHRDALELA